jgi:hypothetical protein
LAGAQNISPSTTRKEPLVSSFVNHNPRGATFTEAPTGWIGSLRERAFTATHRRELTESLARGVTPLTHPELARRAEQLTSSKHRQSAARTWGRLLERAQRPPLNRSPLIVFDRLASLEAEDLIGALVERLCGSEPVSPRAMALLEQILSPADPGAQGAGTQPDTLRDELQGVLDALGPASGASHEFSLGL